VTLQDVMTYVVPAVTMVAGAFIPKLIDLFRAKKSEGREDRRQEVNEATAAAQMYRDLANDLRADVGRMNDQMRKADEETSRARADNARLQDTANHLGEEKEALKVDVRALVDRVAALEKSALFTGTGK
jgi:chromosome segregation ATPase